MSRELIVTVIEVKKDLYKELHNLELESLSLEEEYLFAGENRLVEKQEKLVELEVKQLHTQLKLKRAQLFGLRIAKGDAPQCVSCFTEHDELPEMLPAESHILGARLFRCAKCGRELRLEP